MYSIRGRTCHFSFLWSQLLAVVENRRRKCRCSVIFVNSCLMADLLSLTASSASPVSLVLAERGTVPSFIGHLISQTTRLRWRHHSGISLKSRVPGNCSGLGTARKVSGRCPRDVRKVSGRCPGDVREMSGRCPGDVREMSGRCPGGVRGFPEIYPGNVRGAGEGVTGRWRRQTRHRMVFVWVSVVSLSCLGVRRLS